MSTNPKAQSSLLHLAIEAALAAGGPGLYRVRAAAAQYFGTRFPEIQVIFEFAPGHRVELQLAPAGYSVQVLTP